MSDELGAACRREIEELHRFFEGWLCGRIPCDNVTFERLTTVLDADFEMVTPQGRVQSRMDLLTWLWRAHGSVNAPFRIWIEDLRVVPLADEVLWAHYQEWQDRGGRIRGRTSTALFKVVPGCHNGLQWRLVHETWLEASPQP